MSALPPYGATELITKTNLLRFGAELRAEPRVDLKADLDEGLKTINRRLDQLFIAWFGGMIVIVAAMVGVVFMQVRQRQISPSSRTVSSSSLSSATEASILERE